MSKTALITGAARGIGRAIAEGLAAERFNIVIADIADNADDAVAACKKRGVEALFVQGDISKAASRTQLLNAVRDKFRLS